MELWASSHCSEWSFPSGGFAGKLLEEKPYHALQVQLTTQLKRWGVPKPSSSWLQLSKSGPAPPPPKRQRTEAEKKAAQRAKKKKEAEDIARREEYERLPAHQREAGEAWLMGQEDPIEQRRALERETAEKRATELAAQQAAEEQAEASEWEDDMAEEDFDAPPVELPPLVFD
jgi:hypothetical protein